MWTGAEDCWQCLNVMVFQPIKMVRNNFWELKQNKLLKLLAGTGASLGLLSSSQSITPAVLRLCPAPFPHSKSGPSLIFLIFSAARLGGAHQPPRLLFYHRVIKTLPGEVQVLCCGELCRIQLQVPGKDPPLLRVAELTARKRGTASAKLLVHVYYKASVHSCSLWMDFMFPVCIIECQLSTLRGVPLYRPCTSCVTHRALCQGDIQLLPAQWPVTYWSFTTGLSLHL